MGRRQQWTYLLLSHLLVLWYLVFHTDASACPSDRLPVMGMCSESEIRSRRLFLHTSFYQSQFSACSCRTTMVSDGVGKVVISPYRTDTSTCDTDVYVKTLHYRVGCDTTSSVTTFLNASGTLDLEVRGSGTANHCILVETMTSRSTLLVKCYGGSKPEQTTLKAESLSTPSVHPTTDPMLKACPPTKHPVLAFCTSGKRIASRMYIDTSLYSANYTSCTCTLTLVGNAGGTVNVSPHILDRSSCQTYVAVEAFSYRMGCSGTSVGVSSFLYPGSTVDLEVFGEGAAKYCISVKTEAQEASLQLECFPGNVYTTTSTVPASSTNINTTGVPSTTTQRDEVTDISTTASTPTSSADSMVSSEPFPVVDVAVGVSLAVVAVAVLAVIAICLWRRHVHGKPVEVYNKPEPEQHVPTTHDTGAGSLVHNPLYAESTQRDGTSEGSSSYYGPLQNDDSEGVCDTDVYARVNKDGRNQDHAVVENCELQTGCAGNVVDSDAYAKVNKNRTEPNLDPPEVPNVAASILHGVAKFEVIDGMLRL